ncbi:NUDIX hydrolase [Crossiella sp. NPDC003009]
MSTHGPLVDPAELPDWLAPLVKTTAEIDHSAFTRFNPKAGPDVRKAAVLILLGEEHPGAGPDVLLIRRADGLNSHPGQVSFPGGAVDPTDADVVEAALREAQEEAGVLPESVRPVALLPELYITPSGFMVTSVLGHWEKPGPVAPVDFGETAAVARVPIAYLADPANRFRVRHSSGWLGPAFAVPGMLVWGFTAGLLAGVIKLAGWEQPWDEKDVRDLEASWRAVEQLAGEESA